MAGMGWKAGKGPLFGGYADWEGLQPQASRRQWLWAFAAVTGTVDLETLFGLLADKGARVPLAEQRRAWGDHEAGGAVRLVLACRRGDLAGIAKLVHILHVGPPLLEVGAAGGPDDEAPARPVLPQGDRPRALLGVIDDGIGFLHARFRKAVDRTRFRAVWLQSDGRIGATGQPDVDCGLVLGGTEIDRLIGSGEPEADAYRRINAALYARNQHHSTNYHASHGTHVLDVAAGVDPMRPGRDAGDRETAWGGDPAAEAMLRDDVGLYAVQLPGASVIDTSGRRLEAFLIQGLRWLVDRALDDRAPGAAALPLVVNLSLGSLAGPGDETAFVAEWLRYEVARYERLGRAPMRVVVAYGNAHREKLVARGAVEKGRPVALDWCLQPDDHSPSFLELRVPKGLSAGLGLTLVPPAGGCPALSVGWPADGASQVLAGPSGAVAAVYGLGEANFDALLVALAPSERLDGGAVAPSGRWRVRIEGKGTAAVPVSLRVQRDDTPGGYRLMGRQSWLDEPQAQEWDVQTRDWIKPWKRGADAPAPGLVSREGSAVAYAGANDPRILFVGAIKPKVGKYPKELIASVYSASGADKSFGNAALLSKGPTLAAMADDGAHLKGRLAAGVLSGATARLRGTSVAAPAASRLLLLRFLGAGAGTNDPEADLQAILRQDETHISRRDPKGFDLPYRLVGEGVLAGQRAYGRGTNFRR
ncbi:MAG: hypothetical protein RLZZ528_1959 [Pseudomonadota bacterium]